MNPIDEEYLPYVLTEIFCVVYATTFLFRLWTSKNLKLEEKSLLRMICAYIVAFLTDALSIFVENSSLISMHFLNAASSAVSITAVALGCFFWLQFIELRLTPAASEQKPLKLCFRILAAAVCLLDMLSAFTGWSFILIRTAIIRKVRCSGCRKSSRCFFADSHPAFPV